MQSGHRLATCLSVETEKRDGIRVVDIEGHWESVYLYSTSQLLEAEEAAQLTLSTKGRERKVHTLHQSMSMVVDDRESTSTPEFHATSRSNMEPSCFHILAFYCYEILKSKDVSVIRHQLSLRRPCVFDIWAQWRMYGSTCVWRQELWRIVFRKEQEKRIWGVPRLVQVAMLEKKSEE